MPRRKCGSVVGLQGRFLDDRLDALANRLAERGDFSALVDGIVLSDAFRTRVDR